LKRFVRLDESFICDNCNKKIEKLGYTSRDHCPHCLYSKHVDIMPGDRLNTCKSLMKPISIEKFKDTYKIIYICTACKEKHKNIIAKDDDFEEILRIMQNE